MQGPSFFTTMRKLLLLLLILTATASIAQKAPPWVDYAYRTATYPDDRYLVGLATEIRVEKYQATSAFERLNQMARNQIIEAIHVSIKAESQMNITVENAVSDELFQQTSQSVSKAELVGLKFENYYDKKKKTAYSFSYVLIQDIIDYYFDIMNTNFGIIDKDFAGIAASNDKQTALKLLYDVQLKLREIDQATVILMAMKQTNRIDFGRITGIRKQIEDSTNKIFATGPVTIPNIANYFSYGLIAQTEKGATEVVCPGGISYKSSGAESDFSRQLAGSIYNSLASESSLVIVTDDADVDNCIYELTGSYQDSDNELLVSVSLTDINTGKAIATAERSFKKEVLALDGLRLLPANFDRIPDIPQIRLVGNGDEINIKTIDFIDQPIQFTIDLNGEPQVDIPVRLVFYKDGMTAFEAKVNSDKTGTARYFLNKDLVPKSGEYELQAMVDVGSFLGLDPGSGFYQELVRDNPPQVRKIKLKVLSPTVFVVASEMSLGEPLEVPILEPSIKNTFAELDYEFVDNEADADLVLNIVAATREAQRAGGFYTSYLDATVSLVAQKSGNEIYKKSLSSIKGTAASYELGSIRAYERARDNFLDDLVYELRYNNR